METQEKVEIDFDACVKDFKENKEVQEELLNRILKVTGIKFNTLTIRHEGGYKICIETDSVRPELGVCCQFIKSFTFGLYWREPTNEGRLSFSPSLSYDLIEGGSNGFDTCSWFYYDAIAKHWIVSRR